TFTKELTEGQHILRITITGANCNIDKLNFICTQPTGVESVINVTGATYRVYTTSGVYVGEFTAEGNSDISGKLLELTGNRGTFIIKNMNTNKARVQMAK
ncbi:MAG: hypothetical protein MJY81_04190, partial [Bacteroidaceae bacterium]|nr:hypothetical protein [Bacteroidaceae bacterium]